MSRKVHIALWVKLLLFIVVVTSLVKGQNWALNQLLPVDYDKYEAPVEQNNLDNDTLSLNASIKLNSFTVTEKSQSISTDLILCLNWSDHRIKDLDISPNSTPGLLLNSPLHLKQVKLTKFSSLWLPIVFFRNALSASIVNTLNNIEYVQVWPKEKQLRFCTRLSVSFICRMNVANFPFDEQYCNFELESFEKANQRLHINMLPLQSVEGNSRFRVRNTYSGLCSQIASEQIQFQQVTQGKGNWSTTPNCAFVGVRLVRSISFYVIRYYCPTFLMVCISFVSFWLPTNAWPARIMLTASVLLTLITTSTGAYNEVPAEEATSLVWWLWGMQFFIYLTVAEFAFALAWVQFVNDFKAAKLANKESPDGYYFGKGNCFYKCCSNCWARLISCFFGPVDCWRDPQARNKVDYAARLIFPFMLMVFLLVYLAATLSPWAKKYRW